MEMTKLNDLTAMFSGATGSLDLVPNQRGFNPKDNDDSFTKVMNQAVGNNMDVRADINSGIRRSKPAELKHSNRRDIEGDRSVKDSGEENKALEKTDHKTESKEIKGKLEEKTKDVKDAIKDELSVTDEQIEEAMEALNMEDISLLDPNALKELLMELTGTEDQMSLVTDEGLLGSLNRILGVLDQGLGEISDELGISREDIGQAIEKMLSGEESIEALEDKGEVSDPKALEIAPQNPKETGAGEDKASKDHKKATENNSGKGLQYTEASKTVIKTENNFQNFDNQPKDQNDFQNQMQPQPQITIEMGSNGEMIQKVTSYSSYSESSNIISQVTDQIKLNISAESTTMEMQLHPATLGAVNLQIASENGVMKAHILVQNETVREVLASQMEQLLKTFEEQGQKVSEIDVSVANYNLENGMSQNMEQEGKQGAPGGKGGRRNINLNELSDLEYQELSEEERLEAEMMNMNGSSVLYRA